MWWILLFLFLQRGHSQSRTVVQANDLEASELEMANLSPAGISEHDTVFLPDQKRDIVSAKLHAVSSIGPSTFRQQELLFSLGGHALDASFDLDNFSSNENLSNLIAINRSGANFSGHTGSYLE